MPIRLLSLLVLVVCALPAQAKERHLDPRETGALVRLAGWTKDSRLAVFSIDRHPEEGRKPIAAHLEVLDRKGSLHGTREDDRCTKDAPATRDCPYMERGGKAAWLKKNPLAPTSEPVAFTDTLTAAGATATLERDASGCTLRVTHGKLSGPLFSGACPETSTLQLVVSPDGKSVAAVWSVAWSNDRKCPEKEPCARFDAHFGVLTKQATTPVAILLPQGGFGPNAPGYESTLQDDGWLQIVLGDLEEAPAKTELFAQKGYEPLAKALAEKLSVDLWEEDSGEGLTPFKVKPLTWKSAQPIVVKVAAYKEP